MIVDLSSPKGHSVNDGILEDVCSFQYASVDDAMDMILRLGQGTQMVKLDLQDAYRILPIHPQDHYLLAIQWQDRVYVDRNLPFGLRLAPKLFTAFADMLAWCMRGAGVQFLLHYLDDFLLLGAPGTNGAGVALEITTQFLARANVPVARHKTSFFPLQFPSSHIFTDASGSFGCGAIDDSAGWFQVRWPEKWTEVNIATKELVPIVIAAAVWGRLYGKVFMSSSIRITWLLWPYCANAQQKTWGCYIY